MAFVLHVTISTLITSNSAETMRKLEDMLTDERAVLTENKPANKTATIARIKGLLTPLAFILNDGVGSPAFPDGVFNFTIQGSNSTESATVTIRFPNALSPGVGWWFNVGGSWIRLPASQVSINGANLTITLTGASSRCWEAQL